MGMVRPIEYLRWHERHGSGTHDLATSDQQALAGEWGVAPAVLAEREDPPAAVSLQEQLADVYGVSPDQVLVTAGASHANFVTFATALGGWSNAGAGGRGVGADDDGEAGARPRVLVELPGYEPLRATPAWLGAVVDRFRRPAADNFPLSADRVEAAASDATSLVVTTNRHNPTGRRVGRQSLVDAAAAARKHDARLLVDEVYAPYGLEATDGPFGGPTAAGIEGTVVTSSLTKFFGLGGLRVGWIVADEAFVERARTVCHHVPGVSTPGVALARRALHHREALTDLAREQCRENHALLADFVADREDLVGPAFGGATFAFLEHRRGGADEPTDGDAVVAAAADRDCTVVPGRFFDAPDRFRVSLGGTPDAMAASLSALGAALDDL
jgi:aspartate/methionine/tyrosine aminotransferase